MRKIKIKFYLWVHFERVDCLFKVQVTILQQFMQICVAVSYEFTTKRVEADGYKKHQNTA